MSNVESVLQHQYQTKLEGYYDNPREDLVALVDGSGLRVLDIGCGAGATGHRLRTLGRAAWVAGIEFVPQQAAEARRVLDEVIVGDLQQMALPWPAASLDVVIAGDILEHLVDPAAVLRRLRPLVRPGGVLITSIPNVRHWWVVRDLVLRGEWKYEKEGVMDETHLRFFTRRSARRLLEESGFSVRDERPYFWGPKTSAFDRLTLGLLREFLAQRWLMRSSPRQP